MDARACAPAWLGGAATSTANADRSRTLSQLPGRDGAGEENAHDQRGEERGFELLVHGRCPFLVRSWGCGYLPGLAAINWHVPVVNPGCMTHAQPRTLGQRNFLLQKPLQVVVCTVKDNWLAETVPAHSTAIM